MKEKSLIIVMYISYYSSDNLHHIHHQNVYTTFFILPVRLENLWIWQW